MALFELGVAWLAENIKVFYSLLLTYAFYLALKLLSAYLKKHDSKYLFAATLVLMAAFDLWSRIYEEAIRAFFEQFRFLLVAIPLSVFLIYSILENKRAKTDEEKQKLRGAFQQYVSPSVVEEITKDPGKLKLGGEKKQLTVFFSDIRGFTTLSEKLSPEELVSFLNDYLSQMTNIVLDNKGLVDKYIGDAIMAFWGAPVEDKEHAINACRAALLMKKRMEALREDFRTKGKPDIKIGMGVNSGDMVVGNMGSDKRFDYTVIGDNVNLASRLEGLTKQYHASILMSQSTWELLQGHGFVAREMDLVAVKGKTKPVRIYELVATEQDITGDAREIAALFTRAMGLYYARQWAAAKKAFEQCLRKGDEASEIYIARCNDFMKNPPPEDWDGVFVATTK